MPDAYATHALPGLPYDYDRIRASGAAPSKKDKLGNRFRPARYPGGVH